MFHCFANDAAAMKQVLTLGSLVSFTGIVTFKNGQNVRDTVAATPLGQFMLETELPVSRADPYRGKRCEPAYVKEIVDMVAQVKRLHLGGIERGRLPDGGEFFPEIVGLIMRLRWQAGPPGPETGICQPPDLCF